MSTTEPNENDPAQQAFDEAVEKMPPTAEQQFGITLDKALSIADGEFSEHVWKHWEALDEEKVQDALSNDIDINSKTFDQEALQRGLKAQRALLLNNLSFVKDAESFYRACRNYIDVEMNRLFFVTNDAATTHIGRDYFAKFLESALPLMESKGYLSDAQGKEIIAMLDYYDLHFQMYDMLRREVTAASQSQTSSLVIYALSQDENVDMERDAKLVHATDVLEDKDKAKSILSRTIPMFERILSKYDIVIAEDEVPSPAHLWLGAHAHQIGIHEQHMNVVPGMGRRDKSRLGKAALERSAQILDDAQELLKQHGDVRGLLEIREMYERLYADANHVPINMSEITNKALEKAAEKTLPHVGLYASHHYDKLTMKQPASLSAQKYLYAKLGTFERIASQCYEAGEKLHGEILQAGSVREIATMAEQFVDRAATDIFFGVNEPAMLFFIEDYLKHFNEELAWALHKTGHMEPKDAALLLNVQKKCQAYHQSFCTMKELMLTYSDDVYDHPFIKSALETTAQTGISLPDMLLTHEWKEGVQPKAWETFVDMLQAANVYHKGFAHPLIPLIFKKSKDIALMEYGGDMVDGTAKQLGDHYQRVLTRTLEIFQEAIDGMPEKDPYTGKKIKIHSFDCDEVLPVLEKLDVLFEKTKKDPLLSVPVVGRG